MHQFGNDDGQVVEGDNGGLVNGGQDDGSLLTDEDLKVGDDLVQDDPDGTSDGRNLVGGEVIRSQSLC